MHDGYHLYWSAGKVVPALYSSFGKIAPKRMRCVKEFT